MDRQRQRGWKRKLNGEGGRKTGYGSEWREGQRNEDQSGRTYGNVIQEVYLKNIHI